MNILVVAAHPDDEALGCGGTIAGHAADGDAVHILFLADGVAARDSADTDAVEQRKEYARAAARILGAAETAFAGLPDNRMDTVALLDIVQVIENEIARLQPAIVYTHHGGDLNIDHRIAHQATLTACRPLPDAPVTAIYTFETLSSTEWGSQDSHAAFQPNRFIDISAHMDTKLAALDCYDGEMRPFPHPRSPEAVSALAQLRGSAAGVAAAEAFQIVREVVRAGV